MSWSELVLTKRGEKNSLYCSFLQGCAQNKKVQEKLNVQSVIAVDGQPNVEKAWSSFGVMVADFLTEQVPFKKKTPTNPPRETSQGQTGLSSTY